MENEGENEHKSAHGRKKSKNTFREYPFFFSRFLFCLKMLLYFLTNLTQCPRIQKQCDRPPKPLLFNLTKSVVWSSSSQNKPIFHHFCLSRPLFFYLLFLSSFFSLRNIPDIFVISFRIKIHRRFIVLENKRWKRISGSTLSWIRDNYNFVGTGLSFSLLPLLFQLCDTLRGPVCM